MTFGQLRYKIKDMKKHRDTPVKERGIGVILESLDDKISLVAEQYGDIKKDIHGIKQVLDAHTEILNSHTEILNSHTETLASHTEMIGANTEAIGANTEAVGTITADMAIVKENLEFIKGSLKRKVDVEEFAALERRVLLLEKRR